MDTLRLRAEREAMRLRSLLPPDVAAASQQVAWKVSSRLSVLVGAPDVAAQIRREIDREFAALPAHMRVPSAIIAAVLLAIAAILVLLGELLAKAKEQKAATKDEAKQKQLEATRSTLQQALGDLLSDVERRRTHPVGGRRP
jgi:hypothetical protein